MGVKWSKGHLRARGLKGDGAIRTFRVLARCVCNQSQEKMYIVIVDGFNTSPYIPNSSVVYLLYDFLAAVTQKWWRRE